MQEIILIAAMSDNRVIGKDNAMPWSIKGNLARFKEMTMGCPCVMGRKTWDSLPKKPLPGRLNIIISKTMNSINNEQESLFQNSVSFRTGSKSKVAVPKTEVLEQPQDIKIFSSLPSAIEYCAGYEKIFICGGESIYSQAMPLANKIDLTLIPGQYDGDTFFPEINDSCWEKTETVKYENFSIITYIKINSVCPQSRLLCGQPLYFLA